MKEEHPSRPNSSEARSKSQMSDRRRDKIEDALYQMSLVKRQLEESFKIQAAKKGTQPKSPKSKQSTQFIG